MKGTFIVGKTQIQATKLGLARGGQLHKKEVTGLMNQNECNHLIQQLQNSYRFLLNRIRPSHVTKQLQL